VSGMLSVSACEDCNTKRLEHAQCHSMQKDQGLKAAQSMAYVVVVVGARQSKQSKQSW
jgi:hypothetical protein